MLSQVGLIIKWDVNHFYCEDYDDRVHIYHIKCVSTLTTVYYCIPTYSFAIFRGRRPWDGLQVAQLPAHHLSGVDREVVVTDGAPFTVVEDLHAALVVFPFISRQSELNPGRVWRQLRGGVVFLLWVGVARRVAEVFVLGESQLQ